MPSSPLEHSHRAQRGATHPHCSPLRSAFRTLLVATALLGAASTLPPPAAAHTRSLSHSSWQLSADGAAVKVRIPRLELTRMGLDAPPGDARQRAEAGDYLASRLQLFGGGARCQPSSPIEARSAREGWASFAWSYHCAAGPPERIQTAILLEVAPSHLHFARVSAANPASTSPKDAAGAGEGSDRAEHPRIVERVLTEEAPAMSLDGASAGEPSGGAPAPSEEQGSSIANYVGIGIEHILTGWDHVAFVIALLLLASRLGEIARLVTGFTIAHSLTLALAVLGVVRPIPNAVEAMIGFSVALVAIESAWSLAGRPRSPALACVGGVAFVAAASLSSLGALPPLAALGLLLFTACHFALLERLTTTTETNTLRAALAFAFGLVHGFGFAGILAEMQLPEARLVPALFGFNVGVELGQLAIVALVWPALRALRALGDPRLHRAVLDAACAGICGLGIFWFVSRSMGA